jgi:hypothetical protein
MATEEHPKAIIHEQPDGTEILECPGCGWKSEVDGWDVMGADPGCLFCNGCCLEVKVC